MTADFDKMDKHEEELKDSKTEDEEFIYVQDEAAGITEKEQNHQNHDDTSVDQPEGKDYQESLEETNKRLEHVEQTEELVEKNHKNQEVEETTQQSIDISLENKRSSISVVSDSSEQEIPPSSPRSDVTFSPENEGAFTSEITSECSKIIHKFTEDIETLKTQDAGQNLDQNDGSALETSEEKCEESTFVTISTPEAENQGPEIRDENKGEVVTSFSEKTSPVAEISSDFDASFTAVSPSPTVNEKVEASENDEGFVIVSMSDVSSSPAKEQAEVVTTASESETEEKSSELTCTYQAAKSHTSSCTVSSQESNLESVIDKCSNQLKMLDLAAEDREAANETLLLEATLPTLSGMAVAASSSNTKTTTTVVTKIEKLDAEGNIIESSTIVRTTDSESQEASSEAKDDEKSSSEKVAEWGKPLGLPSPANPSLHSSSNRTPSNTRSSTADKQTKSRERIGRGDRKISPVYMDLTYVPHHGDCHYSDVEFFKKVRARYYVFSGVEPSKDVLNALLEAKMTWENKDLGKFW